MTQTKSNSQTDPIPGLYLLEQAMTMGCTDSLREWLQLGFDLNDRRLANPKTEENILFGTKLQFPGDKPLLIHAVDNDHDNQLELLGMLLEAGADPYVHKDAEGFTALMRARNVESATLLIDHGADVNATASRRSLTAAYMAVANNNLDMLALLHSREALLDVVFSWGHNLLHESHENLAICKFLIEHCPQLLDQRANARNGLGDTPMTLAIRQGSMDAAKLMVSSGAEINVPIFVRQDITSKKDVIAKDVIELAEMINSKAMADWLRAYQSAKMASDTLQAIAKSAHPASP